MILFCVQVSKHLNIRDTDSEFMKVSVTRLETLAEKVAGIAQSRQEEDRIGKELFFQVVLKETLLKVSVSL